MTRKLRNLVFEGGGVKGVAYVGALEKLAEEDLLSGIENVGGTSAGAITALMVGLGYTPFLRRGERSHNSSGPGPRARPEVLRRKT